MTALKDKVVVITGASSGIGAALAERIAKDGALPVLVARRADALGEVEKQCNGQAIWIPADVTSREEVRRVVAEVIARVGRIDVWVNNVGKGITLAPSQLTDDDIDEMMRVNVKSALYGMQETLPYFKSMGHGHVINVSSMLGRMPSALFRSAYSASKHFLSSLTENFRSEVKQTHPGIEYSIISPGVVYTDFGKNAAHGGPDSRAIPGGQPVEEVADVIAGVIASRRPDVYTRAGSQAQISSYFAGLGADP